MAHRFLISRLSALGDVVCCLPAAAALKAGFPGSQVTWVVDPRFAGIVECCASVDVVVRAKPGFNPATWPSYVEPFDFALDLQGLLKSALAIVRAKAERKIGYHWQREGAAFFSERILLDPSSLHIVDQYVDVARAVGGVMDRAEFALHPRPEDIDSITGRLSEAGVTDKFVAMNAGAGWVTKRWPPEMFAALIESLRSEGIPAVLLGGKGPDLEVVEAVRSTGAQFVSFAGLTSVRELVALLSLASAHVGGDTGSTHIAAALGTPAIGLYSITNPKRSCPYGQIERCHYEPEGLSRIAPSAVLASVVEAIGR